MGSHTLASVSYSSSSSSSTGHKHLASLVINIYKELANLSMLFSIKIGPKDFNSSHIYSRVLLTTSTQNSSSK